MTVPLLFLPLCQVLVEEKVGSCPVECLTFWILLMVPPPSDINMFLHLLSWKLLVNSRDLIKLG